MTDWEASTRLSVLWNDSINKEFLGDTVDVMTVLVTCTTIATAYINALLPADREKCQKMYLMHLESSLNLPSTEKLS